MALSRTREHKKFILIPMGLTSKGVGSSWCRPNLGCYELLAPFIYSQIREQINYVQPVNFHGFPLGWKIRPTKMGYCRSWCGDNIIDFGSVRYVETRQQLGKVTRRSYLSFENKLKDLEG